MPYCLALAAIHFVAMIASSTAAGNLMLGREPIIDRDHDQLAFMGELAAGHIMGIEIADHPAAAVEEHEASR